MYNSISCLKNFDGSRTCGRENIGAFLGDHFSSLFSPTNPGLEEGLSELVEKVITGEDNVILCMIPDKNEIFSAISELVLNKAPSPDGMTGLFYKSYCPIVKSSVVLSVQSFFRGGFMLKEFNHTNIALIPKVENPSLVNQFKPINLTNFNYKIILKST